MKKKIFTTAAILLLAITMYAKTITVSNNPTSPGQYTTLQAAIDAAVAGDVLLVTGSGIDYGQVTVNKQLTIYGQGYDPRKDIAFPTTISYITLSNNLVNNTASGTVIAGCNINSLGVGWTGDPSSRVHNIVLKRSKIGSVSSFGDNWLITDNIITSGIQLSGSNYIIKNNACTSCAIGSSVIKKTSVCTVPGLLLFYFRTVDCEWQVRLPCKSSRTRRYMSSLSIGIDKDRFDLQVQYHRINPVISR